MCDLEHNESDFARFKCGNSQWECECVGLLCPTKGHTVKHNLLKTRTSLQYIDSQTFDVCYFVIYRKKELEEEKNRLELLLRNRSDSLHHVEEELKMIGSQQWQSPEYVNLSLFSLTLISLSLSVLCNFLSISYHYLSPSILSLIILFDIISSLFSFYLIIFFISPLSPYHIIFISFSF